MTCGRQVGEDKGQEVMAKKENGESAQMLACLAAEGIQVNLHF